jgi:hypothetical protein
MLYWHGGDEMDRQEAETTLKGHVQMAERLDAMLRVEQKAEKEDDALIEVAQAELGRILADEAFGAVSAKEVEAKRQELRTLKLRRLERPLLIGKLRKREKGTFKERTRAQKAVWKFDVEEHSRQLAAGARSSSDEIERQ